MSSSIKRKINFRIPPFSCPPFSASFKSITSEDYKEGKKLLHVAKSGCGNDSSEEEECEEEKKDDLPTYSYENEGITKDKDRFSLREKLAKIYLECAKKKVTRNGSFIKCNYLEELVVQEDLSYFIMKIYPTEMYLYFKNPYIVKYVYHSKLREEPDLFDSIDKEEIPIHLLSQILSCEDWFLMYDYHCFLRIQKYALKDLNSQPIFSDFVLLKPTTEMLLQLVNNSASADTYNNNGSCGDKLKDKQESKICLEISGPLYLDVNPAALEVMDLLKTYQSPFGSTSLKTALDKRPRSNTRQFYRINLHKEYLLNDLAARLPPPLNLTKENFVQLNGSAFSHVDLKEHLHSKLADRNLLIRDDDYTSQITALIEVFELKTFQEKFTIYSCESAIKSIKYISVFFKNGQFYSCLTFDKYTYDHEDSCDPIKLIGGREELDRYILKVAEILSHRFTRFLSIRYEDLIHSTNVEFFPPLIDDTTLMCQTDVNSFKESRINGTKKYNSDTSEEEKERKLTSMNSDKHPNKPDEKLPFSDISEDDDESSEKEFTVKDNNWVTDLLNDKGTDIFKITPQDEYFDEPYREKLYRLTGNLQEKPAPKEPTPVFETASFQRRESTSPDPRLDILYPIFTSKFEFSKEDFLGDLNQDIEKKKKILGDLNQNIEKKKKKRELEKMKKLLSLI